MYVSVKFPCEFYAKKFHVFIFKYLSTPRLWLKFNKQFVVNQIQTKQVNFLPAINTFIFPTIQWAKIYVCRNKGEFISKEITQDTFILCLEKVSDLRTKWKSRLCHHLQCKVDYQWWRTPFVQPEVVQSQRRLPLPVLHLPLQHCNSQLY